MDSQKNENVLNLALDTPLAEREKSLDLNVGFVASERTWEVIVKYHGSIQQLAERGIRVEELIAGYAILTVPESDMVLRWRESPQAMGEAEGRRMRGWRRRVSC